MAALSLEKFMPPPEKPIDNGASSMWEETEKQVGTTLPSDYKAYINIYGTGAVGNFLWIFSPFTDNKYMNLLEQSIPILKSMRSLREKFPEERNYSIYPEKDGVLPCGCTDNGDYLFWRTTGSPDQWTIVFCLHWGPTPREEHPYTLTVFLEKLLLQEIDSDYIAEPLFDRATPFHPLR